MEHRGINIVTVCAFAHRAGEGNPAAVCILPSEWTIDGDKDKSRAWMQTVAGEMNLSETAFAHLLVAGTDSTPHEYGLRWFTPTAEVALCGHATLATAHVLYQSHRVPSSARIVFHTLSGPLICWLDPASGRIHMDFPASSLDPISHTQDSSTPSSSSLDLDALASALRLGPQSLQGRVLSTRFDVLVVLDSEDELRSANPDLSALVELPVRGIIVTAPPRESAAVQYDFVSRFFAPRVGVPEDPVTGSAHCALAPYWAARLSKDRLVAYQASKRGGTLYLTLHGQRVEIAGDAVMTMSGQILY
eukprot:TRINITY_DN7460_c0_g1_i1.p1 TRINITY_DN7460_c0_g1~~TRINITY_DN7460_c0_g1_i1.p1  ORF type:complete len:304 (-),score=52.42 TRINITY_DN7460_c0_g1_i1:239-1150(-)